MAKKFTIDALYAYDLRWFFTRIDPQLVAELKPDQPARATSQCQKISDELEEANQEYEDTSSAYSEKMRKLIDDEKKKLSKIEENDELDDEERKRQLNIATRKVNERVESESNKLAEEYKLDAAKKKEVEIVIQSNDRFDLLKEVFEKHGHVAYKNDKKPLPKIFDALDTATEA